MSNDKIKSHYSEMSLRLLFKEEDWAEYYAKEEVKFEAEMLSLMKEQKLSPEEA